MNRTRSFITRIAAPLGLLVALAAPALAAPPWHVQSDYRGTRDVVSQPRSLRGLALSPDDQSLYGGFIQGTTSAVVRKVRSSDIPGTITVGSPDIQAVTGVIQQAKGVATDDRGYVYATLNPFGASTSLSFRIHSADLSTVLGTVVSTYTSSQLSGISVAHVGANYYAYLSRNGGAATIERWDVTNPAAVFLDVTWGIGGRADLKTLSGNVNAYCNGLEVAADGTVYAAGGLLPTTRGDAVFRLSANGLSLLGSASVSGAMDVAIWQDRLYVAQYLSNTSSVAVLDRTTLAPIETLNTGIPHPYNADTDNGYSGVAISAAGRLFVADQIYDIENPNRTNYDRVLTADIGAPVVTCPGNIDTNSPSCTASLDPGTATAVDGVDGPLPVNGVRSDALPLNAPYPNGTTTITWTATDNSGNSGSCVQTVTIHAADQTVTTTVNPVGAGSISGPATVACGSGASYTISTNPCNTLMDVTVNGVSLGAVTTVNLTDVEAPQSIVATFTVNTSPITASAGPGGSIAPSGTTPVNCGSDETYTITADPCFHILDVLVDNVSVGPVSTYTFTNVQAPHMIAATFASDQFTITSSAGPGGTLDPAGAQSVACGDNATFTAAPAPGYHLDALLVDGNPVPVVMAYTFTNVQTNHTIEAQFAPNANSVATVTPTPCDTLGWNRANIRDGGTVDLTSTFPRSGTGSLEFGSTNANSKADFVHANGAANFLADLSSLAIDLYRSSASTSGAHLVPAVRVLVDNGQATDRYSYLIWEATYNGYGPTFPTDAWQSVNLHDGYFWQRAFKTTPPNQTIEIYSRTLADWLQPGTVTDGGGNVSNVVGPNARVIGFEIGVGSGWSGTFVGAADNFRFGFAGADSVFNFETGYTITAGAGPNGSISPAGPTTVLCNQSKTFTMTPDAGFHIDQILVDGSPVPVAPAYTFNNVNADHSITVTFASNTNSVATVKATPCDTLGWNRANIRDGGTVDLTSAFPRSGTGSLEFGTTNANSKADFVHANGAANFLATLSSLAIDLFRNSVSTSAGNLVPAVRLLVDNGQATNRYSYLIWEAAYNGYPASFPPEVWQALNLENGYFWQRAFKTVPPNQTIEIYNRTLSDWLQPGTVTDGGGHVSNVVGPNARVIGFEIGVGSGWGGTFVGAADNFRFGFSGADSVFNFETGYTITASAGTGGTIDPVGALVVPCDGSQSFTITADPCHHITDVLVDGVSVGPVAKYTFNNVNADHTIAASFAIDMFTLTINVVGSGSVAKTPDQATYECGSSVMLTPTAADGWQFTGWSGDASGADNPLKLVMDGNKNITATFDVTNAVLLSRFDAKTVNEGVALTWQFGGTTLAQDAWLERSVAVSGPWAKVEAPVTVVAGVTTVLDRAVQADRTYEYRVVAQIDGKTVTFAPVEAKAGAMITQFGLAAVSPNPTNDVAHIEYTVARSAPVSVSVLDLQGRVVASLVNGTMEPGRYETVWSGRGDGGRMPAGLYFVRFQGGGRTMVKRIALAR